MVPLLSDLHELGMPEATAVNQLECFELHDDQPGGGVAAALATVPVVA